jgi:hypothetical protein
MPAIGRGFDIDDFRAVMARKGVARNNLYKLIITPPPGLQTAARTLNMPTNPGDVEDITLFCDSVTMPGLSIATVDSRPYGYGPTELKAHTPIFQPISATFIVDAKGYTLSFFRNWMRGIVNYTTEGKAVHRASVNNMMAFEAAYKAEYETTLALYVLSGQVKGSSLNELDLDIVSKTVINRAFPIEIGSSQLSYSYNDQYLTLPVSFSYFDWYTENLDDTGNRTATQSEAGSTGGDINVPFNFNAAQNRR